MSRVWKGNPAVIQAAVWEPRHRETQDCRPRGSFPRESGISAPRRRRRLRGKQLTRGKSRHSASNWVRALSGQFRDGARAVCPDESGRRFSSRRLFPPAARRKAARPPGRRMVSSGGSVSNGGQVPVRKLWDVDKWEIWIF